MAYIMPFQVLQRLRNMNAEASDPAASSQAAGGFTDPTPIDIVVARIMLSRGKRLPPDIVDAIFDHAEYWAHSSNEIDYNEEHKYPLRITGTSKSENKFLLRSYPVGFTGIDGEKSLAEVLAYDTNEAKPLPLKTAHDRGFFAKLANYPTPRLASPVRKVVFTMKSRDQGRGGTAEHSGTYKHSWTWFDAGVERFDADQDCDAHCTYDVRQESPSSTAPAFPVCALRPLEPRIAYNQDKDEGHYDHHLLPQAKYQIQRNKMASREWKTHVVTWSYLDSISPDSDAGKALEDEGRGRSSGDGSFVSELKVGDVVTIWGKARFPAWVNMVEKVKIDIYWAV